MWRAAIGVDIDQNAVINVLQRPGYVWTLPQNDKSEQEMTSCWGRFMRRSSVAIALYAAAGMIAGSTAFAQKTADDAKSQVAWVKICKETTVTHFEKKKDAKPTQMKKELCRTRFEQLAPFAAMSVQIQEIKGVKELGLIISFSLPQQMAIKPGILAAVYTADQWAKVQKKEKLDEKKLKILKVGYTRCGPGACNAEVPAPGDLIADMRKGAVMLVKAFRGDGQVVEVPVSLAGFSKVLDGKPTDLAKYEEARKRAMQMLNARRNQILAQERARRAGAKIPEPKAQ